MNLSVDISGLDKTKVLETIYRKTPKENAVAPAAASAAAIDVFKRVTFSESNLNSPTATRLRKKLLKRVENNPDFQTKSTLFRESGTHSFYQSAKQALENDGGGYIDYFAGIKIDVDFSDTSINLENFEKQHGKETTLQVVRAISLLKPTTRLKSPSSMNDDLPISGLAIATQVTTHAKKVRRKKKKRKPSFFKDHLPQDAAAMPVKIIEYYCHISYEIAENPCIINNDLHHVYDKKNIDNWFSMVKPAVNPYTKEGVPPKNSITMLCDLDEEGRLTLDKNVQSDNDSFTESHSSKTMAL